MWVLYCGIWMRTYLNDLARSVQAGVRERSAGGRGALDGSPCGRVVKAVFLPRGDSKDL